MVEDVSPKPEAEPDYLGDGVYVEFDGFQVWLRIGDHRAERVAALEPGVMQRLVDYARRCGMVVV